MRQLPSAVRLLTCLLSSSLAVTASGATLNADKAIAAAKAGVVRDFKDPASAQFRDVRVVVTTSEKDGKTKVYTVCGEVNAKNSFGAYVGFQRFVAPVTTDLQGAALATAEPGMVAGLWPKWCVSDQDRAAHDAVRALDAAALKTCDAQAGDRLGNERESFLRQCMQSVTEDRLKACNSEAGSKAGDARKAFMAKCLAAS